MHKLPLNWVKSIGAAALLILLLSSCGEGDSANRTPGVSTKPPAAQVRSFGGAGDDAIVEIGGDVTI